MKVVLFCGGMGTRLRDYFNDIPKPMVPVGYRPILWHVMRYYAHFGHREFILCLGYKGDAIKQYFMDYNEYESNNFTMKGGGRELVLENSDIQDWEITFVDTGLTSNIGQRLAAVRKYLGDDDYFLANYSDGLTDLDFNRYWEWFRTADRVAGFLCVKPSQTFHVVSLNRDSTVRSIECVQNSELTINGGYFIFRKDIFDSMRPGEELVREPFQRLMENGQLVGYRYDRFWCMDTFKEHQELTDLYTRGEVPWEVWREVGH